MPTTRVGYAGPKLRMMVRGWLLPPPSRFEILSPGPRFPHTDERVRGPEQRHGMTRTHHAGRLWTALCSLSDSQPTRDRSYCCFSQAVSAAELTPPVITQGSPR